MCVCVCIMLSSHRHIIPSTATTTTTTTTATTTGVSAKAAGSNLYDEPPPYSEQIQPVVGGSMNYKCEYICEENVCGCI